MKSLRYVVLASASALAYPTILESSRSITSCSAVEDTKTVAYAWGSGQQGQLGISSQRDESKPTLISTLKERNVSPLQVSSYQNKSILIARRASGDTSLFAFGVPLTDELAMVTNNTPTALDISSVSSELSHVSMGSSHAALVATDGTLYTIGDGYYGQLGLEDDKFSDKRSRQSDKLVKVDLDGVVSVSCGHQHTLCVLENGECWSFGRNQTGALGIGKAEENVIYLKQKIKLDAKVVQVEAGYDFSVFLDTDGKVYTCGANDFGQLGLGSGNRFEFEPKQITAVSGENIVKVAAGDYHCALLNEKGEVFCFGLGKDGQTGQVDRGDLSSPELVPGLANHKVIDIACGGGHTAAVTDKGELLCWGRGRNGQLGRADHIESIAAYRTNPLPVDSIKNYALSVSCGGDHTIGVFAALDE